MKKQELINLIRKHGIEKKNAIMLISDLLHVSMEEAKEIYHDEFERRQSVSMIDGHIDGEE